MKKITKSVLAASAGLALLIGTGGTLAYWNDAVRGGGAGIQAGQLTLAQRSAPVWQVQHTTGQFRTVADPSTVRFVPGDKLVYTGEYEITAQGDNLVLQAEIAPGSITPTNAASAADQALMGRLLETAEYQINDTPGTVATIPHRSGTPGAYTARIAVTLTWPFGTEAETAQDNAARTGQVTLNEFTISAQQLDAA